MKKTQRIELFRNIKKTLVSFVAICMFVLLAVSVFTGITATSVSALTNMDDEMRKGNMHDFTLIFPYGFTDEDVEAINALDYVTSAEGTRSTNVFFDYGEITYQAKIKQLTEGIDTLYDIEGELPDAAGEMAIEKTWAEANGVKPGDTIVFWPDDDYTGHTLVSILEFDPETDDVVDVVPEGTFEVNEEMQALMDEYESMNEDDSEAEIEDLKESEAEAANGSDAYAGDVSEETTDSPVPYLSTDTFVVTGLVHSSEYLSTDSMTYGASTANKLDINCIMYVTEDSFDQTDFPGYTEVLIDCGELDDLNCYSMEYEELADEIRERLTTDLKPLTDARNSLVQSQVDAVTAAGQAKLDEYAYKLDETEAALDWADYELANARDTLVKAEAEIDMSNRALNAASSASQNNPEAAGVNSSLAGTRAQVRSAAAKAKNGREEYEEGLIKVAEGREKLARATEYYNTAVAQFEDYKAQTDQLVEYSCTIIGRGQSSGVLVGSVFSEMLSKLRYSMASLFLIVGILVCYSAVSRIVNDQMISIGTKKALGLNQKEITRYYMTYTMLATLIGVILGLVGGYVVVQYILLTAFSGSFIIEHMQIYLVIDPSIIAVCLAEFVIIGLVTYAACARILKRPAVELLKGPAPDGGRKRIYESMGIWSKLSLMSKTIINNCVNDGRRVFATLVGVAGCTALLVTAIMLRDDIFGSLDKQYSDYYKFDSLVLFENYSGNADELQETEEGIADVLDEYGLEYSEVTYTRIAVSMPSGMMSYGNVFIPYDEDSFSRLFVMESEEKYNYNNPYDGVWISGTYSNYFDTPVNSRLTLYDSKGEKVTTNIDGYFKNYLTGYQMVMSPEKYEELMGEEALPNCYIVDTGSLSAEELDKLTDDLGEVDDYLMTEDYYGITKRTYDSMSTLAVAMVALYIVLSIIMALLVLLNLMTMFVNEKKKELIVLMINGFSIKDAKRYIYSDTIVLTVIGTILGLFLGTAVGYVSLVCCESESTIFLKTPDPAALVIGTLGSFLLTYVISKISLKKIEKFRLRDINEL